MDEAVWLQLIGYVGLLMVLGLFQSLSGTQGTATNFGEIRYDVPQDAFGFSCITLTDLLFVCSFGSQTSKTC